MYNSTIKPFDKKVWLATPTMHGEELNMTPASLNTEDRPIWNPVRHQPAFCGLRPRRAA